MAAVEERVQAAVPPHRPAGEPPPACGPGCSACCTVNVGTLPLEGAAAAAYLRRRLPPEQVGRPGRGAAPVPRRGPVAGRRRAHPGPGPLPVPGRAGRVRHPPGPPARLPRAQLASTPPTAGSRSTERGEEEGPGLVRMNLLQKALYDEAIGALAEVLARRGLDARRRDVSGMTGAFLADPARAAAFAAGARVPIE